MDITDKIKMHLWLVGCNLGTFLKVYYEYTEKSVLTYYCLCGQGKCSNFYVQHSKETSETFVNLVMETIKLIECP